MANKMEPKIVITSKTFRYANLILYEEKARLEKAKLQITCARGATLYDIKAHESCSHCGSKDLNVGCD